MDICNLNFDHELSLENLPALISSFCASTISVFDKHAPFISKTITDKPKTKTLSTATSNLKLERNKAYAEYKKTNTLEAQTELQRLNKQVKYGIYKDTKDNFNTVVESKGIHFAANKLCKLGKKTDGNFYFAPDTINDYFVAVSCISDLPDPISFPKKPSPIHTPTNSFSLVPVSRWDVLKAWHTMKKATSTSHDTMGLCPNMINLTISAPNINEVIVNIVQLCMMSGVVPESLKSSKVIPLAKVKCPSGPNQLRPIAIQPILSKLIERCVYKQLIEFLNSNNVLSDRQFGFRAKHSTVHAQLALTDHFYREIDNNNICILVSLDLSKAFDKVNRELLLHKFAWYNIGTHWFESYLNQRSQHVSINGKVSQTKFTNTGVAQGSLLGPILFALLINDLPLHLQEAFSIMFVYDTNFSLSGSPKLVTDLLARVVKCIESVDGIEPFTVKPG